nr:Coenzyme F420 hydrogenase/dehydrogenase, beta subunit C-terminal domain [uncultured Blautia sp.]
MKFNKEKCCGCSACLSVCPVQAIEWVRNEEGFSEPHIIEEKCIDCGLCRKVCPYEDDYVGSDADPDIYAAVHKDKRVVLHSSSGGAFTALSDAVLRQGGVVYGVRFDQDYVPEYGRAEDKKQRSAFRGSKYVQCDPGNVYKQVEKDLSDGRSVMFTGTPCYVSGLKKYLSVKKINMEKLFLCDNICHGAASPLVWKEYLQYIQTEVLKGKALKMISMRGKKVKWQKQEMECATECGDESAVINKKASWNKLYSTTYATRKSCFSCPFTGYERNGDITVADYWNIENAGVGIDYKEGVSLLLINTKKGREWFEQCKMDLNYERSDKKSSWQIHLERQLPAAGKRSVFWQEFESDPHKTVQKYSKGSLFNHITRAISPLLRKIGLYTIAVRILTKVKGSEK